MSRDGGCVALITGRGGSKRLPGKNVRPLAGRPLVAWTVDAAQGAKSISRVIVSTDDPAIAEAAKAAGSEVPFMRPKKLSGDNSSHVAVIAHALDWLEEKTGELPDMLCLLQPTSPLRLSEDIDALVTLVKDTEADCGITVSAAPHHPAHMFKIDLNGKATPFLPPATGYQRSQDLPRLHVVNGAVYVIRPRTFREREAVLSADVVAHIMPDTRSVDIDTEADFLRAESLMRQRAAS